MRDIARWAGGFSGLLRLSGCDCFGNEKLCYGKSVGLEIPFSALITAAVKAGRKRGIDWNSHKVDPSARYYYYLDRLW